MDYDIGYLEGPGGDMSVSGLRFGVLGPEGGV